MEVGGKKVRSRGNRLVSRDTSNCRTRVRGGGSEDRDSDLLININIIDLDILTTCVRFIIFILELFPPSLVGPTCLKF